MAKLKTSLGKICGSHHDLVNGYGCLWHRYPRICSVCRSYIPVLLSSFMSYLRILNKSNTTGATSGAGTVYPSEARMFVPVFQCGVVLFNLSNYISPRFQVHIKNSSAMSCPSKNEVRFVFTPICFVGCSCFIYVICFCLFNWCSTDDVVRFNDGNHQWSRNCGLPYRGTSVHSWFCCGSSCLIVLCRPLLICWQVGLFDCLCFVFVFVFYLFAILLSLSRFICSDYLHVIYTSKL